MSDSPPLAARRFPRDVPRERAAFAACAALFALLYGAAVSQLDYPAHDAGAAPYVVRLPLPAPPLNRPSVAVTEVDALFARAGYDLGAVKGGAAQVPPLYLPSLPADLAEMPSPGARKRLFVKSVLPLILRVNAEILDNRRRLDAILAEAPDGKPEDTDLAQWLEVTARSYGVEWGDWRGLLRRMDAIPPSLALAQAAIESGWGASRFAHDGNALFGQRMWGPGGMVPLVRDKGETHRVRRFPTLLESVRVYAHNLNTHRAYRGFRAARANMRADGLVLKGRTLAHELAAYSERGRPYVRDLLAVIRSNDLTRLDATRLAPDGAWPMQSAWLRRPGR